MGFGDSVDFCELIRAVSVLALETISAETDFCPVLAHFTLVFLGLCQRNNLPVLYEGKRLAVSVECGGAS